MAGVAATITSPIALCGCVISAVFGLLAKKWNSTSYKPRDKQLFYLASGLAAVALVGGLLLAWNQSPKSMPLAGSVDQTSYGDQSPNVNSSGSGAVTVQTGGAPTQPGQKPVEKKK